MLNQTTPHHPSSRAEQAVARDISQLWDRVGDEMGIHLKSIMYAVRLNDAESEKDFFKDTERDTYRFYLCEGVPIDNKVNGPSFGSAFDKTRNVFLHCLKEIATEKKLDLFFPDDVFSICCNTLEPLRQALDIMKKKNAIVTSRPKEPEITEEGMRQIAQAFANPSTIKIGPEKSR